MIYLKSALAGLLTAGAATIVLPILVVIGIVLYSAIRTSPKGAVEGSVGWDPISLVHPSLPIVTLIVVCFASGFFWEFRRLRHR
jgi:hypothetical protein